MFWKFNLISTSHIESILSKENVTLEELMDEDDILQECKAQNKNLIDFLIRDDVMDEMIDLIIKEPSEELEDRVRYKYSNIACELLTSDVPQINNILAYDEALLMKLYKFLEKDKPLNPLLASFFSKTMGILITRETETVLEFLKSKENFVNLLLGHLSTSAIMDLLLRLVTCVENGKLRTEVLLWLNNQQIVQRLVALIDPCADEERHSNASQSLSDIIRFSREQMSQLQDKAEPDPLLQTLESSETVGELLDHMFNGDKNESALVNGISVILALLEFKKQGSPSQVQANEQSSMYFRPESHEQMTALDAERMATGIKETLKALKPRLKEFHDLLEHPPSKRSIPTTLGLLDQPLGNTRIHVARLITCVVSSNTQDVNVDLAQLGTVDTLLDLFFKFTWNNFLHTQVEQCIGCILSSCPDAIEGGEKGHPLLNQLLRESCLVQRILEAWEDNEQQQAKPGGNRRGYMGHLTKIANHIAQNADKGPCSEFIKDCLKDLSDDHKQKWELFVTTTLAEINKKNQITQIGGHPLQSSSEDDDPDFRDIPFPQDTALQQAFSDYQMQQMTSNFIDQFGFNDDEFGDHEDNLNGPLERLSSVSFNIAAEENTRSADLFEQACNERIQPFDDADSDEDIWVDKVQDITFAPVPASTNPVASANLVPIVAAATASANSEESSSDSDEDLSAPPAVEGSTATTDEMKMDIDQNDPWAAMESVPMDVASVAMDTANPWDTSSRTAQQTDVGWANFAEFSAFGSAAPPPVAMETSEVTESCSKYVAPVTSLPLLGGSPTVTAFQDPNISKSSNNNAKDEDFSSVLKEMNENTSTSPTKAEPVLSFSFPSNPSKLSNSEKEAGSEDLRENGPVGDSSSAGVELCYPADMLGTRCKDQVLDSAPPIKPTTSNGPV